MVRPLKGRSPSTQPDRNSHNANTSMTGHQLIEQGLLTREQLSQAEAHQQKNGGELEDSLIGLNLVAERDFLAACAKTFGMQFLTRDKVRSLHVSDEVLDRL